MDVFQNEGISSFASDIFGCIKWVDEHWKSKRKFSGRLGVKDDAGGFVCGGLTDFDVHDPDVRWYDVLMRVGYELKCERVYS